jgi:diguanylate cyclase
MSPRETSIARMQEGVTQYQDMLVATDEELRGHCEQPDAAAIEATFTSIQEATHRYRDDRDQAHEAFEQAHRDQPQFSGIRDDLQAVVDHQNLQIETLEELIEAFDFDEDLADGCRQMVDETSKLIETSHQLRDTLDRAMAGAARTEPNLAEVDASLLEDPLTGLATRTGLEARLLDWWEKGTDRHHSLHAAALDIDDFGRVNQQYGQKAGDELIRAVAEFLKSHCRGAVITARLAGQRFLVLFGDTDSRSVTDVVERTRQALEMSRFDYRGQQIRLTLSCAVVQVGADDTSDSLIARTEAVLSEAKRCGRNRTFVYEGGLPAAVIPPNFPLEEQLVAL